MHNTSGRDYFENGELRVYLPHAQHANVMVAALVHERTAQPLKHEMRDLELISRGRSIGATRISLDLYKHQKFREKEYGTTASAKHPATSFFRVFSV